MPVPCMSSVSDAFGLPERNWLVPKSTEKRLSQVTRTFTFQNK